MAAADVSAGDTNRRAPEQRRVPFPAPPKTPATVSSPSPSRGREREMRQLIHDLAVLAATRQHPQ